MNEEIYIAADLGNSQIRMMAAKRDENGLLDILCMEECKPKENVIQHGIVKNSSEAAFAISNLSKKLTNRLNNRHRIVRIYLSVNGRSLRTIRHRIERSFDEPTKITKAELADLQKEAWEIQSDNLRVYDITAEEYGIDSDTLFDPEGAICSKIEANYLVACALPSLHSNLQKCIDHQQTIDDFIPILAPRAIADAVSTHQERNNGCAVINIGAATTTVTVYHDGILRNMAIIPFGGQHITNDLQHLGLTAEAAEKIKCSHSSILHGDDNDFQIKITGRAGNEDSYFKPSEINGAIRARLDEITELCLNEIHRSGYSAKMECGIILTGGGSKLKDIALYMEGKTGIAVRPGSHAHNLSKASQETYSDAGYALLTGILLNADKPCTQPEETFNQTKNKPHTPKKRFMDRINHLFSDNESSIED